jgi:hypothetical protein
MSYTHTPAIGNGKSYVISIPEGIKITLAVLYQRAEQL